jgi:hypothetical protein
MPIVSTVTAIWNGFTGAPGYSKFRFAELAGASALNAAGAAVRAFFQADIGHLLTGWSIQVQGIVQHHDVATGNLMGEAVMTTVPAASNGAVANTTVWAGGTGYVVNWTTGAVINGKKVRGRTFMVPITSTAFSNDGTVISSLITTMQSAGQALIADASTELVVWSKLWDKKPGEAPAGVPPKQIGGALASVNGCLIPDRAAQLRTRRS